MRKVFIRLAMVMLLLVAVGVKANAIATASDTAIQNFATMTASGISEITSNTVTANVASVYGLASGTISGPAFYETVDKSGGSGDFATYTFSVVNNANMSDILKINFGAQGFGTGSGTATDWSVQVDTVEPFATAFTYWNVNSAIEVRSTAAVAGDWASQTIAPGARATFTVRVYIAADAIDASTMSVSVSLSATTARVFEYTGYNGTVYGGVSSVPRLTGAWVGANITTTVSGAVLTIAKAAAVTAPAGYVSGGGNVLDPVPGAIITYTITYGNTGPGAATLVVITDEIPAFTTYVAGSIFMSAYGAQSDAVPGVNQCGNPSTTEINCNVGTVAASDLETITYQVTID